MEYSKIGKIQNTHGLDGKLIIIHTPEAKNIFQKTKHLFIEVNRDSFIPYFIEEKKNLDKNEILIRLDEVDSVESARELLGKGIFIEKKYQKEEKPDIREDLTGFTVIDKSFGNLGKIEDIFETPGQVVAALTYKSKEILIPLMEQTVLRIDMASQQVQVDLPHGLIDIYLD